MPSSWIGMKVKRVEDPALLTGEGQYIDDISRPGMLHAVAVRSPYAHARILGIDKSAALELPGVVAVVTHDDLPEQMKGQSIPMMVPHPVITADKRPQILCRDEVCFVGDLVAMVLAEDRYVAEDAVALVDVDYEELDCASWVKDAAEAGAPSAHADLATNIAANIDLEYGEIDHAFATASHVITEEIFQHRGSAHSMETRGCISEYDDATGQTRIWVTSQSPHQFKGAFADMMDLVDQDVHVIVPPDVGGGFGPKAVMWPEQFVIPACALIAGRPVKWIEDRREHFMCAYQERDQHWSGELALDAQGKILGLRARLIHDTGAYVPWGVVVPWITCTTVPGPYVIPAYEMRCEVVFTNKVPVTPVRGAGRPQAATFMERMLDIGADRVGIGRDEIRRRNFVQPEQMPYEVGLVFRDGKPVVYDSGDYPQCQAMVLEQANFAEFGQRQRQARSEGRYIGIGTASYIEATGLGPFEGVSVHVQRNGKVIVHTGAAPQGQGHQTMLAQVVADSLGCSFKDITVKVSDTTTIQRGVGTFASRITPNAAPSAHLASNTVREKILKIAAHLLETSVEDLEVEDSRVSVKGVPEHGKTFRDIATFAGAMPGFAVPAGLDAVLEDTVYFAPERATYANGAHCVEVEVDAETGHVSIIKYSTAHDCGTIINPLSVNAQVMGGVAHGIGNALFEWMRYDDHAQPVTMNFGEYLLPTAPEVPNVDQSHMQSPTPLNPLGAKGAGEGGTIPAIAAIVSAIESALEPFGVCIRTVPVTPDALLDLIDAGRQNAGRPDV